nr:MAG TPA: hypothetical protein [Caudoviricetes sp.]
MHICKYLYIRIPPVPGIATKNVDLTGVEPVSKQPSLQG